ncbi:D-alanyl-D-alanine carboxypeptidase family protein [Anaerophilus nitritogenes]|uniref:D-alanyl-D-alanine carboxypeptidase family protein n=1 Tax=Anaerophilus nitritogenes TaxID=2498136 RepID=UPI001FAA6DCD|nr:D-alanyl-D-alanine carboxypeptidase family protein [Anaerophilus nitritogenes]
MKRKISIYFLVVILMFQFTTLTFAKETVSNSASSAIVMDVKSGRILYQKNIYEKKPMASTTKIMTALLGIEKSKLDKEVKISKKAVGVEGSSIYLGYDEKVKMKDLLYGLMLRSGNDSATAIAIELAGSVEKFAQLMNQRAKEIGAKNTNFVNPHGLHDENHYTTAYDLALISREALRNKDFKEIVKTKLWIADREGYKHFYNKNKTLSQYEGGDGVKTGYTKASGRCLVTSATRGGMQLVCVVLNDYNWFEDSYRLLDDAFNRYEPFCMMKKDGVIQTASVENGKKKNTKIVGKEDVILPLTKEEQKKIMMILKVNEKIQAPIKRGQKIGKARIYLNNQLIYTTDLVFREDIECKNIKDKILDYFSNSNQF